MSSDIAERETSITWSDADNGLAIVWTAQRPMVTRLAKIRGAERVEVHRTEAGVWTGETWHAPIGAVLPRNPGRRTYTEAQRSAMRERARKLRSPIEKSERSGHSSAGPGATREEFTTVP